MATTTNYNWSTPDDTALVKDGAAAIRTLGSSIDTTTKALNPSTTLGDIEYRSSTANTNTRLGIGSSGQVLAVSNGVPAWSTISTSAMTLISTTTLSGASTTITVAANTYIDLLLRIDDIDCSQNANIFLQLNGETGATAYAQAQIGARNGSVDQDYALINCVRLDAQGYGSTGENCVNVQLFNANSTIRKVISVLGGGLDYQSEKTVINNTVTVASTAVLSSIVIKPDAGTFDGGTVRLYGVK